jgi:hypothetical protein
MPTRSKSRAGRTPISWPACRIVITCGPMARPGRAARRQTLLRCRCQCLISTLTRDCCCFVERSIALTSLFSAKRRVAATEIRPSRRSWRPSSQSALPGRSFYYPRSNSRKCETMRDYYLDDLKPGDAFSSPRVVLTEQDVIEFAEKYDSQPRSPPVTRATRPCRSQSDRKIASCVSTFPDQGQTIKSF